VSTVFITILNTGFIYPVPQNIPRVPEMPELREKLREIENTIKDIALSSRGLSYGERIALLRCAEVLATVIAELEGEKLLREAIEKTREHREWIQSELMKTQAELQRLQLEGLRKMLGSR